jgi:hypothetical protein
MQCAQDARRDVPRSLRHLRACCCVNTRVAWVYSSSCVTRVHDVRCFLIRTRFLACFSCFDACMT